MAAGMKALVAGNWKMNGTRSSLDVLRAITKDFTTVAGEGVEGLVCVPATLLSRASEALQPSDVHAGGQDCHASPEGAHTGDISAEMLADCGAKYVIVGHSERRTDHNEGDADVAEKARAAWRAGLVAIVCVGETRQEREAGKTLTVLSRQIAGSVPEDATADNTVVAYEPVWAIGTGLTPTTDDIAEAHAHLRRELEARFGQEAAKMRLLYGGSVKPDNARELLAIENVNGALVGGASLKADDFLAICKAAAAAHS